MKTLITTEFERLKYLLEYIQLPFEYTPVDENNKVEQMAVSLGNIEGKPVFVQILFLEDVVQAFAKLENEKQFFTLQFYVDLPVVVNNENIGGLSSLILSLNPFISLGSFGISNTDDVFYRYNLLQDEREIKGHIVTEVLENIIFYFKSFVPQIIEFSEGKSTLDESLNKIFNALQAG